MISNAQISDHFSLLSKLMDIHGENEFRAKSLSAAAFQIEKLPVALAETDPAKWTSFKGIGESAAKKIKELLETGLLADLQRLLEKTPQGVLEMMSIKGLGPKKIAVVWKEMGIESIGELLYACEENRLLHYKGFGEKTQATLIEHIRFYQQHKNIHLYRDIEETAASIQQNLQTVFPKERFILTGSFRRQMEIIEKLEWVTTLSLPLLSEVLTQAGFEMMEIEDTQLTAKNEEGVTTTFYHATPDNIGSILFTTSSSPTFLNHWGKIDSVPEEEMLFAAKNRTYLPSFLREETSFTSVPENLISTDSIKGIIHSHSNWSDGTNTLQEMADACIRRGWEYLVISDHSKTASYAGGLVDERVKAQHQLIDELNEKLHPFRIFKSIESDILGDGALDYHDALLSTFDLVIASVHSNLRMNEEKAMMRLMRAIENPYTTILGHMTGRLLLSRNGYPIDHKKIIDACVANQVAIELNAHPRRLDIDWRWISYGMEKGAMFSINPDAHALSGYDDIRYGVLVAQKGGMTIQQNLSSKTKQELEAYLSTIRKAKNIS